MNVCLVRCPSPFLVDERLLPPLGLMAVGTALKVQGHTVHIHDGDLTETPMHFSHYGFGPTTPEYDSAVTTQEAIRAKNPTAKIIIGGPHATLNPEMCLEDGFDAVVVGDGEVAASKAFQNGRAIVYAEERPLDEYPSIDRTILDIRKYRYALNGRPATTMLTGQGCPYQCAFCAKNYKTVRFRSVDRVAEEIRSLHEDYGYTALAFPEDIFIMDQARTVAICRHLQAREIIWRCLVRGDLVVKYGPEFLQTLADSGCVSVSMGIESGSDTILRNVHKGETATILKQAIRMVKDVGMPVKGFFIVGLPGETRETLAETRAFLDATQMDEVDFKIYQPFPGSPIWRHRERYDIQWDDSQPLHTRFYKGHFGEYHGSLRTAALTTQQIYDAWVDLERNYKRTA
jgi:anaerobic magnesium-protoporphyrin IX monomethyl ester cyclase